MQNYYKAVRKWDGECSYKHLVFSIIIRLRQLDVRMKNFQKNVLLELKL